MSEFLNQGRNPFKEKVGQCAGEPSFVSRNVESKSVSKTLKTIGRILSEVNFSCKIEFETDNFRTGIVIINKSKKGEDYESKH